MGWFMSFLTNPPALDPLMVPFWQQLIAGNVITVTVVWAILKYCAYKSEWTEDDKIIEFISGLFKAARDAVPKKATEPSEDPVIITVDDKTELPEFMVCELCGQIRSCDHAPQE